MSNFIALNDKYDFSMPDLQEGDSDPAVVRLKQLLGMNGTCLAPDTYFDPATTIAVIKFQRQQRLIPTGIVDNLTWTCLCEVSFDVSLNNCAQLTIY